MQNHIKNQLIRNYYPANIFICVWIGMFLLRSFGFMQHENISINTYLTIFFFIFSFLIGYFLGVLKPVVKFRNNLSQVITPVSIKKNNLGRLTNITIFFSIICCISQIIKLQALRGEYNVVEGAILEIFSQVRQNSLGDPNRQLGSNVFGIISNILFGFPVLAIFICILYKNQLTKKQSFLLNASYWGGLFVSFASGGRFTAFSFLLMYYFLRKVNPNKYKKKTRNKNLAFVAVVIFIFYIFAQIFIARLGNGAMLIGYIESQEFNSLSPFAKKIILDYPSLSTFFLSLVFFDYYITHSIDQLNYLLNSSYPLQAPYWGAYQFSAFVIFFNKLGLNLKTIDVIISEIPNPGVYFSMIGGIYLDFNYIGIALFTLIIGYLTAYCYKQLITTITLKNCFWHCIFTVISSLSPVISIIGTGYFPSIIVSGFFIFIYCSKYQLPSINLSPY